MAVVKDPRELETAEPFVSLFPIDPDTRHVLRRSMREHGYIKDKSMLAWRDAFGEKGRVVLVDGHGRRGVAIELGITEVTVTLRRFDSVEDALLAAIDEQSWRRSLNRSQLAVYVLAALATLDHDTRGQGSRNDLRGRSAQQLGDMLGVTRKTIERARRLIDFGDEALLERVKSGDLSLNKAIELGQRQDAAHSRATAPPTPRPTPKPKPGPYEWLDSQDYEPEPQKEPEPERDTTPAPGTVHEHAVTQGWLSSMEGVTGVIRRNLVELEGELAEARAVHRAEAERVLMYRVARINEGVCGAYTTLDELTPKTAPPAVPVSKVVVYLENTLRNLRDTTSVTAEDHDRIYQLLAQISIEIERLTISNEVA